MRQGIRKGATGDDVRRLHRVLLSATHQIDPGEVERGEFGPSTLAALHAFQIRHGLKPTASIDAATLEILLRLEENITINVNESAKSARPAAESRRGIVQGKLVDEDEAPDRRHRDRTRRKADQDGNAARQVDNQQERSVLDRIRAKNCPQSRRPRIGRSRPGHCHVRHSLRGTRTS